MVWTGASSLLHEGLCLPAVPSRGGRGLKLSGNLILRPRIPFMGVTSLHDLTTLGVRIPTYILGGHKPSVGSSYSFHSSLI